MDKPTETDVFETAKRVLPGGTFGNFPGEVVIREGKGGRVWDEEGKEYVDFLLGSGPMLVGHAHPEVTEAAHAQIAKGTTFFANNRLGIELAEAIVDAVPCAEQVRFVSSGSEADLYAMRAARAFTRKDKILKFEGGYHGMSDYSLMSLAPKRSGNFPAAVPDSAGIPKSVRDDMLIAPFNDAEAVADLVHEHKGELAGVIVEPFQRIIPPAPGFLAALRKITADNGIPLIFDEVVTGFRLAYGGAQEYYGVVPDLCTLGKVIGGGFPLAAIAGKAEIMAHFDRAKVGDENFLVQIGTLSGIVPRRCLVSGAPGEVGGGFGGGKGPPVCVPGGGLRAPGAGCTLLRRVGGRILFAPHPENHSSRLESRRRRGWFVAVRRRRRENVIRSPRLRATRRSRPRRSRRRAAPRRCARRPWARAAAAPFPGRRISIGLLIVMKSASLNGTRCPAASTCSSLAMSAVSATMPKMMPASSRILRHSARSFWAKRPSRIATSSRALASRDGEVAKRGSSRIGASKHVLNFSQRHSSAAIDSSSQRPSRHW